MSLQQFSDSDPIPTSWFNEVAKRANAFGRQISGTYWQDGSTVYGYDGNGGLVDSGTFNSDDAAVLTSLIENTQNGGRILCGPGAYRPESHIEINEHGVRLEGQGHGAADNGNFAPRVGATVFQAADGFTDEAVFLIGETSSSQGLQMDGIYVDGNNIAGLDGIRCIRGVNNTAYFNRIHVTRCLGKGIHWPFEDLAGAEQPNNVILSNSRFQGNGIGIRFQRPNGVVIDKCSILNSTTDGIEMREGNGNKISGCYIEDNGRYGIFIDGGVSADRSQGYEVSGCRFENNTTAGILANERARNLTVIGGRHTQQPVGIDFAGRGLVVIGGDYDTLTTAGVQLQSGASRIAIIGADDEQIGGGVPLVNDLGATDFLRFDGESDGLRAQTLRGTNLRGLTNGTAVKALDGLHVETVINTLRMPSMNATQRGNLTPANGDLVYNNTTNRVNAYQNGGWINLDDGTAA